jgi:methyl coenzyme M reductase subunit C-like uncharacterized protein (methanogenesis marker protein 7)
MPGSSVQDTPLHIHVGEVADMARRFLRMAQIVACMKFNELISVALVRVRTIPTEQPPLVGKVSVNLYG